MKQKIVYKYDFSNPFHQIGTVLTLEELQNFTQLQTIHDQPCKMLVSSVLQTIDPSRQADKKKIFSLELQKDPTIIGETTLETIPLWIVDRLLFSKDIPDILRQKYGQTYNFDKLVLDENLPIRAFDRLKHNSIGLVDPKTGRGSDNSWHTVYCEQFQHGDIVVNKLLCQIWDAKENTPTPTVLNKLFENDYGLLGIER